MTWSRFFSGLKSVLWAIVAFFGRLVRDIGLEVWRPVRRRIVKWGPIVLAVVVLGIFHRQDPEGAKQVIVSLLALGMMFYGLYKIVMAPFGRKKK